MRFRDRAQKAHGVWHRRVGENLVNACTFNSLACIHNEDIICSTGNNTKIMGYKDNCCIGFTLRNSKQVQHLRLDGHIKGCSRFIGNDHIGVIGNSDSNHNALAHTP